VSVIHVVVDHVPSPGHSDAYFALAGALIGAVVVGLLGLVGQRYQSFRENERLRLQLGHDRDLRDLEVLRVLCGDAAEALGSVRKAYIRMGKFWSVERGTPHPKRDEAEAEQREAAGAARSALDRLRLQLAPSDPLMAAYEVAMRTLDEIAEVYVERSMSEDDAAKLKKLGDKLGDQMARFAKEARIRVGPRAVDPEAVQRRRWWS
jgi:hypothetical protein